jgi:hypothetical protein
MTTADAAIAAARARQKHEHCSISNRVLRGDTEGHWASHRIEGCHLVTCYEFHGDPLRAAIDRIAEAVVLCEAMSLVLCAIDLRHDLDNLIAEQKARE